MAVDRKGPGNKKSAAVLEEEARKIAAAKAQVPGQATSSAKAKQDSAFQEFMQNLIGDATQITAPAKENPDIPVDLRRFYDGQLNLMTDRRFDQGIESALKHIDTVYEEFQSSPFAEARNKALANRDAEYAAACAPAGRGGKGRKSADSSCLINDGKPVPPARFDLNPEEQRAARIRLTAAIEETSALYAAEAGISQKDLARILGGIAVIESQYGVARSVRGAKHRSSASGAFHYLDGTAAGEIRQNMGDQRIAGLVAAHGVNPGKGITVSEVRALKEDDQLSSRLVAIGIVKLARERPDLRGNPDALATAYYMRHNMGEGGVRALQRGGAEAVARIDRRIIDNNESFFRNGGSNEQVTAQYRGFMAEKMASFERLYQALKGSPAPALAVRDPRAPQPS